MPSAVLLSAQTTPFTYVIACAVRTRLLNCDWNRPLAVSLKNFLSLGSLRAIARWADATICDMFFFVIGTLFPLAAPPEFVSRGGAPLLAPNVSCSQPLGEEG